MNSIEYETAKNVGLLQGQIDCLSKHIASLEASIEHLQIENHFQRKRLKCFEESLKQFELSVKDNCDTNNQ